MNHSPAYRWKRYKSDFLRANRCTVQEFGENYVAFIGSQIENPDTKAYLKFADKYGISIIPDANIPYELQVVLSVNIAAVKVMADTYEESIAVINDILGEMNHE